MPGFLSRTPEEQTAGYLPEDASTLKLIKFECTYPAYSNHGKHKDFLLLLHRFMPENAISVAYSRDPRTSSETCSISCWISDSELDLIEHATGCVDGGKANEKVLLEAIDILEGAYADGDYEDC